MLSYNEDEMLRQTFGSITHPDDTEPAATLGRQLVNGEIDHFQVEKRYLHKDGHIIWVEAAAARNRHRVRGALFSLRSHNNSAKLTLRVCTPAYKHELVTLCRFYPCAR